jgi:hypothetical protein
MAKSLRIAAGTTRTGRSCTRTRSSHQEEETAQLRSDALNVTALHEQTPDEKPGD